MSETDGSSGGAAGESAPPVAILMGSDSDWPTMRAAGEVLDELGVRWRADVVSAHRMPARMLEVGAQAAAQGVRVIVAGAGGSAHLPGMLASVTPLPVIGVPVPLRHLDGMDSLLSIVQMPAGIPVATMAIGGARNAGLMAARILASCTAAEDLALRERLATFAADLQAQVQEKGRRLREQVARDGGTDQTPG